MRQAKIRSRQEGTNMKIVVLDGYTENPGDLSWSELEKLPLPHYFIIDIQLCMAQRFNISLRKSCLCRV